MKSNSDSKTHWFILLSILGIISVGFFSCNEKAADDPKPVVKGGNGDGTTDDDDDDDKPGENGNDIDVCDELDSEKGLKDFDELIGVLCKSDEHNLNELRDNYFTGSLSKDNYILEDSKKSNISEFTLSNAMKIQISAKSYFELMELKFKNPDKFDKEGYKVGEGVKYKVIDDNNPVKFSYENTKYELDNPASLIEYEAETDFITIKKDSMYAIATKMTKDLDTIKTLQGLIVIRSLGASRAEVISVSIQSMDNGDNHDTAVKRMKDSTETELGLSYKNAEKKGKEK